MLTANQARDVLRIALAATGVSPRQPSVRVADLA